MKKNYKLTKNIVLLFIAFTSVFVMNAQVVNNGLLYLHANSEMHITEGSYTFGVLPATTTTSRSLGNYGVLSFSALSNWAAASSDHFVDGYTRYYGTQPFVVPSGDQGVYAPVSVLPSTAIGVDVAYVKDSPTVLSSVLNSAIVSISNQEYWLIKGATTSKISLSWRSTSLLSEQLLTPSLTYLTIVGYTGSEWVEIPSFFDTTAITGGTSTVESGSISSLSTVNLASFEAFSLGVKTLTSCYPTVVSSGSTKTWNGSWSPSAPEFNDPVVINAPFSGSLQAYSVALNDDITLENGDILEVISSFSGDGIVVMSSEAVLLQRDDNAIAPSILLTKVTNPMRRFDYTFLSSPLADFATFFGDLTSNTSTAVDGNSDGMGDYGDYAQSAFYNFYTDGPTGASVTVTANNVPVGRGLAATVKANQAPYSTSQAAESWWVESYPVHITTGGLTNNGLINLEMPAATGWFRLGNPYPSPLNAQKFLDALGDNVRKTIYYWTASTPRQNWANNVTNYNGGDYATFNYSGGVSACVGCPEPNGMIATMQSVYVRKNNVNPVTFNFTNCLRDVVGNDLFYRNEQDENLGKFRLNLVGSQNTFSQILIAYNPASTMDYDEGYDSPRMTGGIFSELNSLIGSYTTGFAIQTRYDFTVTDVVPLQLVHRTQESLSISLASTDGIFSTGNVTIYLHDKLLNYYHDFAQGSYTFTEVEGTNTARFEIVYQNNPLSVSANELTNAIASIQYNTLLVKANRPMIAVKIYDLTGRLIKSYDAIHETELRDAFNFPQSVYIAKITLDNDVIVSQKIINQ